MTKATTRRFFWGGTVFFTLVFIGLTIHTHTTIGARTNADALTPEVARGLRVWGAYNCENCHTLMGEGAYYAPDLTKAWLDPAWVHEDQREQLMLAFLQDPAANARTFGSGRRMPDLGITEREARGIVAFLKWMSSIDTNGFPRGFTPLDQEDGQ